VGIRVAVDLASGDDASAAASGVSAALDADPDLAVVAVGPRSVAGVLASHPRVRLVDAFDRVAAAEDPGQAVRARRGVSVRLVTRLVRDGYADAAVCPGPTAATTAAATFVLGLVPGVTRPALAVAVATDTGRVVVVDAGADPAAPAPTAELLVQHALLGSAVAAGGVREQPRVALLGPGAHPWALDGLRRDARDLLAGASVGFVGIVDGDVLVHGGYDVAVTDGATGHLLLAALQATSPAVATAGGIVVGVDGVVVAAPGGSDAPGVGGCVATAAEMVRSGLLDRVRRAGGDAVGRRRELAGLR